MKKFLIIAAVASTALYLLLASTFDYIQKESREGVREMEAQVTAVYEF